MESEWEEPAPVSERGGSGCDRLRGAGVIGKASDHSLVAGDFSLSVVHKIIMRFIIKNLYRESVTQNPSPSPT